METSETLAGLGPCGCACQRKVGQWRRMRVGRPGEDFCVRCKMCFEDSFWGFGATIQVYTRTELVFQSVDRKICDTYTGLFCRSVFRSRDSKSSPETSGGDEFFLQFSGTGGEVLDVPIEKSSRNARVGPGQPVGW
jgi:hypothetical protein